MREKRVGKTIRGKVRRSREAGVSKAATKVLTKRLSEGRRAGSAPCQEDGDSAKRGRGEAVF